MFAQLMLALSHTHTESHAFMAIAPEQITDANGTTKYFIEALDD